MVIISDVALELSGDSITDKFLPSRMDMPAYMQQKHNIV